MATIGRISTIVSATTRPFTSSLSNASGSLRKFGAGIGGFVAKVGIAAAAIQGFRAAIQALTSGISAAADLEQNEIAFTTLLGSADRAKAVLKDVSDFAASTPFQLPQLTDSAKSLAAFGFAAENIVPTLRRIGDISAGLGQPVNEIAEIYGKARVQGRLFGEDINQLTGRGIPIIAELAKQFGVAESEVKKLVSEGKVGFEQLEKAFISMTSDGGKFAGLMAAQSTSLAGLWSTFKDNVSFVFRDIAQAWIDAFDVKSIIDGSIRVAQSITKMVAQAIPVIKNFGMVTMQVFDVVWQGAKTVFSLMGFNAKASFQDIVDSVLDWMISIEFAFKNVGAISDLAWEKMKLAGLTFLEDTAFFFYTQLPEAVDWFADHAGEIFINLWKNQLTAFENLAANIRSVWDGVLDFFAGKGFSVDWTPLTEGFVDVVSELPDISTREISEIEKAMQSRINKMSDDLKTGLDEFTRERRLELGLGQSAQDAVGAPAEMTNLGETIADGVSQGVKESAEAPAALERGTAEAFSAILKAQRAADPAKETAEESKKQTKIQKQQLSTMKNLEKNLSVEFVAGEV